MIEEFPEINFPHIKYLAATGELAQTKKGVYLGGDQNSGLIVDNVYQLYTVAYAPTRDKQRTIIWAARGKNVKTIYHINLKHFKLIK